jgi:hypothetical protein
MKRGNGSEIWRRKKPHNFGGAGAVMQCGSGSDGCGFELGHRWIQQIMARVSLLSNFSNFKNACTLFL